MYPSISYNIDLLPMKTEYRLWPRVIYDHYRQCGLSTLNGNSTSSMASQQVYVTALAKQYRMVSVHDTTRYNASWAVRAFWLQKEAAALLHWTVIYLPPWACWSPSSNLRGHYWSTRRVVYQSLTCKQDPNGRMYAIESYKAVAWYVEALSSTWSEVWKWIGPLAIWAALVARVSLD